ncbi:MAG: hypothetical protein AAFX44_06520 [Pseudomonadota bacterium]
MTKGTVTLFVMMTLSACASTEPPAEYSVTNQQIFQNDYDAVWNAVVEAFAVNNIAIKTIEKSSGIIAAERLGFGDDGMADCGKPGSFVTFIEPQSDFNVLVRSSTSGTAVMVNAKFSVYLVDNLDGNDTGRFECSSTGVFERDFLLAVTDLL